MLCLGLTLSLGAAEIEKQYAELLTLQGDQYLQARKKFVTDPSAAAWLTAKTKADRGSDFLTVALYVRSKNLFISRYYDQTNLIYFSDNPGTKPDEKPMVRLRYPFSEVLFPKSKEVKKEYHFYLKEFKRLQGIHFRNYRQLFFFHSSLHGVLWETEKRRLDLLLKKSTPTRVYHIYLALELERLTFNTSKLTAPEIDYHIQSLGNGLFQTPDFASYPKDYKGIKPNKGIIIAYLNQIFLISLIPLYKRTL